MRNERRFNKFLKERFLRNIDGFSLAEIMVAAGILGMISLGVMQMTQNLQKNQKKFQYDAEINDFIMKVQMGLRDKAACERTFAGGSDTANSPPNFDPAQPLQPATTHANAITPEYALSTALINRIYSGNEDADGNAKVLAEVGQQYGAVGGTFTVQEIKLFDTVAPTAMNELVEARVAMKLRKLGSVDDQGDGDPSNDILKGAWGRAEVVKSFSIMVSVWDAGDPNIGGNTPGTIRSCYVQEDFYVQGACNAIGGRLDTDGVCKNVVFGKWGETYQDKILENESQGPVTSFQMLVDGDSRLKNSVEVGYDTGDATPNGGKDRKVEVGTWDDTADDSRPGMAFIQNYLFLGYPVNNLDTDPDVPLPANDNAEKPGTIVSAGNILLYPTRDLAVPTFEDSVSNILNEGSIYTGFSNGDDITTAGGDGGIGGPGEIVASQGMTIRNKGNTGYGVNIMTDGAGANKFLLRIGDNAGFVDSGADANTILLAGNDGGGVVQNEAHLRLGGNNLNHQITGANNGIGINEVNPQAQLDVNGDSRFDGNVWIGDGSGTTDHNDYDMQVEGNAFVNGYLKLKYPLDNDLSHKGSETFDRMAATVGWVRNRIAATLAPTDAERQDIADDVLNTVFREEESALRVIQRNYCTQTAIEDGSTATAYTSVRYGSWNATQGRCYYRVRNCGYNNHCHYVYANTGMISDGYIRTVNGYIRAYGANGYIRAQQYIWADTYMYATSYIRGRSYLFVDSYVRGSKFCIGGTDNKANCMTRIPKSFCGSSSKLRGLPNGYNFCAWDIHP